MLHGTASVDEDFVRVDHEFACLSEGALAREHGSTGPGCTGRIALPHHGSIGSARQLRAYHSQLDSFQAVSAETSALPPGSHSQGEQGRLPSADPNPTFPSAQTESATLGIDAS